MTKCLPVHHDMVSPSVELLMKVDPTQPLPSDPLPSDPLPGDPLPSDPSPELAS